MLEQNQEVTYIIEELFDAKDRLFLSQVELSLQPSKQTTSYTIVFVYNDFYCHLYIIFSFKISIIFVLDSKMLMEI